MEDKILELLNQLVEGQKETNTKLGSTNERLDSTNERLDSTNKRMDSIDDRLDRIERKIDSVIEQTADLTEFRTEMNDFKKQTINQLEEIKDNLNNVEVITASNWKDIAKLKAVK